MPTTVVYDSDHPGARENICFAELYAEQGPGHSFTVDLGRELNRAGIKVKTADVFLNEDKVASAETMVLAITDMVSKNTNELLKRGVVPFLCLSTESPLIARRFYSNIRQLAGRYVYNLQFRGTEERLRGTGTLFSPMFYPVESRTQKSTAWNERHFLVLINRNKRAFFTDTSSLKNRFRSILSRAYVALQKIKDPWIRSKEIYRDRIEAIYYFSNNQEFFLYGQGWNNPISGFGKQYSRAAIKAYRGPLGPGDKLKTMSRFKFAICFENCAFPGYVTEKIFDCFLAGCIPVYLGAPDIATFVPENTFIDFRKFRNLTALEDYMLSMTEAEAMRMINNAMAFLESKEFDRYDQRRIIDRIVDRVVRYPKTESLT